MRVSTQEQRIAVRPIPADYPSDQPWLPAIAVTATVDFEPSPAQTVNVGDTIVEPDGYCYWQHGHQCAADHLTPNEREFKIYQQPTTSKTKPSAKTCGLSGRNRGSGSRYAGASACPAQLLLVEYRHRNRDDHRYPATGTERYGESIADSIPEPA